MSFPAKLRSWISQFLNRSIEVRLSSQLKCLRIGSDYGGWSFCPQGLGADSVIYSAGIGDDLSFDLGMIERFGCAVHAFDPTPRCFEWVSRQQLPQQLRFFPEAVGGRDETLTLYPLESPASVNHTLIARPGLEQHAIRVPCSRIPTLMNRFQTRANRCTETGYRGG